MGTPADDGRSTDRRSESLRARGQLRAVPGRTPETPEERFRHLVETIPAIVYVEVGASQSPTTYVSPRIHAVLGYQPDRFLNHRAFWNEIMHPEDLPTVLAADEQADRTHARYVQEYRLRDVDGAYHWFHDEAEYLEDEDGGSSYWQGILVEITERKEMELRVRDMEIRYRSLVEHIPAVVYIEGTSSSEAPEYMSPHYERLFGYSVEERIAEPGLWTRLLHPDDREETLAAAEHVAATGETFSRDYRMIARDGRIVWVHDDCSPVLSEDGTILFWQGLLSDITDRKRAEGQLAHALEMERHAVERLRELDEIKNTFLTTVSHDLRTPLAAILGNAVTLEREEEIGLTPAERRELAHSLAVKARKLSALVTDLLDLDRLTQSDIEPRLQLVDVGGFAAAFVQGCDLLAGRRVVVDVAPAIANVDPSILERIIENLLANAVRHTPAEASIWVRVRAVDGGADLLVEDDGPGVPSHLRDVVFRAFERGPTESAHSPGVGVGLSLVSRFAQLHGGRAWVQEREGGGASFRVHLPGPGPAPSR